VESNSDTGALDYRGREHNLLFQKKGIFKYLSFIW